MDEPKFYFVYLPDKKSFVDDKKLEESFTKWYMLDNLKCSYYNFNQPFGIQQTNDFVSEFFKSPQVYSSLQVYDCLKWSILCQPCDKVEAEVVPCTVTSMEFFDRILDPKNKVIRCDRGNIIMKNEVKVDEFYSGDNLRACLLEEDSHIYGLYSESERKEFIFKLLLHFSLGGYLCQYEDNIKPYIETVKKVYKDLIAVNKIADKGEIRIRSLVIKIKAFVNNISVCPSNPHKIQNFAYLIVDPFQRQVACLIHQYGD